MLPVLIYVCCFLMKCDFMTCCSVMICRFIYVPAPHIAEVIAEELAEALVEWNLDEKLSTVTVDNCTSNDKAIELLVKKLGADKLMLQGTLLHMRCCAHILNLIVKDG